MAKPDNTNYLPLFVLQSTMIDVADVDTADDEYDFVSGTLLSHSGAVAYTVQQIYGGDIFHTYVKGHEHYWNRMPVGEEIDLSAESYGGEGLLPLKPGTIWKGRDIPHSWRVFHDRVEDERL